MNEITSPLISTSEGIVEPGMTPEVLEASALSPGETDVKRWTLYSAGKA